MQEVLKDDCPLYSTAKIWATRFRTGHFEVTDVSQSGRPTSATTEDKANTLH
ncbi:hypothetical protein SK128_000163, partial [Halocaridina rubra]